MIGHGNLAADNAMHQDVQPGGGRQFKAQWKIAFFVAACCVLAAAIITIIDLVLRFEFGPFNFINQIYLLVFGGLMFCLDIPIQSTGKGPAIADHIQKVRQHVYVFVLFMTRFTGRGVWYMFLGTMTFASLWDNNISPFLGFFLGGYVIILGGVTTFKGFEKSRKLEMLRKKLIEAHKGRQQQSECPPSGMTQTMFKELAQKTTTIDFDWDDCNHIIHALSDNLGATKISKEKWDEWLFGLQDPNKQQMPEQPSMFPTVFI